MLSKIVFVLGVTIIGSAIACKTQNEVILTGEWAPTCKEQKMIPMTEAIKQAIVDMHNELRSKIATGEQPPYEPAAKMGAVKWDKQLEDAASMNVHQCDRWHDDCGVSKEFPYAGQNLAVSMRGEDTPPSPEEIAQLAMGWYKEQENGTFYGGMEMIKNFNGTGTPDRMVGHFTQLIWESANRVGCALSQSKYLGWYTTWLACDYSYGNMIGSPVYEVGPAATKCSSAPDPKWKGLCSTNETYTN